MSRGAIVADLVRAQAKGLTMPAVARGFEALVRQAHQERWSYEESLHEVLAAEATSRAESAVRQRVHEARFPEIKTLDQFDVTVAEGVEAPQVAALARGGWIAWAHSVLLVGPIGTGKTHLGIALGIEAARQRRRVGFWRTAELVRALLEAKDARELGRLQRRLARLDLVILDELGCAPRGADTPCGLKGPPRTVAAVLRS